MTDYEDDPLSIEDFLIHEGHSYRTSNGNKGLQLNVRECQNPECGSDKWKVYFGQESSVGNCFSCGEGLNLFKYARFTLQNRGGSVSGQDVGRYLDDIRRSLGYRPRRKIEVAIAVEDGEVRLPTSGELPYTDGWMPPYLLERGIDARWAKHFHLRFSAVGYHSYQNHAGKTVRQDFSQRIVIPVYNLVGQLVTFQGRDVSGFRDRYLFAGGLPGTGRYLYNGHTAFARHAKRVCMGEGAFDVARTQISLSQYPDTADVVAIGSWGKKLSDSPDSDSQIQAFQRLRQAGLEEVTIMWDGESEAYDSALDAAAMLMKLGLQVRIATLPAGKDPAEVDARVVRDCFVSATPVTRLSLMRLRMNNPYKAA